MRFAAIALLLAEERPHGGDRAQRITLRQGVAVEVLAENDYAASCEDGNNYHVFLNEAGRVVVEKAK